MFLGIYRYGGRFKKRPSAPYNPEMQSTFCIRHVLLEQTRSVWFIRVFSFFNIPFMNRTFFIGAAFDLPGTFFSVSAKRVCSSHFELFLVLPALIQFYSIAGWVQSPSAAVYNCRSAPGSDFITPTVSLVEIDGENAIFVKLLMTQLGGNEEQ